MMPTSRRPAAPTPRRDFGALWGRGWENANLGATLSLMLGGYVAVERQSRFEVGIGGSNPEGFQSDCGFLSKYASTSHR